MHSFITKDHGRAMAYDAEMRLKREIFVHAEDLAPGSAPVAGTVKSIVYGVDNEGNAMWTVNVDDSSWTSPKHIEPAETRARGPKRD